MSAARSKPVVYLAGPYSNPDPVENMHNAIKLADRLLDVCVPMIPHLTGTWHMVSPKPYPVWLELDLVLMAKCDVVFRFGGASSGADAEVAEAERNGQPVVFNEAALRAWVDAERQERAREHADLARKAREDAAAFDEWERRNAHVPDE